MDKQIIKLLCNNMEIPHAKIGKNVLHFYPKIACKKQNSDYRNKFDTFMTFLRRYLSVVFDNDEYNYVNTLEEIIKMTKSFRDYDRENDIEEGKKEGEFSTVYNFIKQGLVTIEQAAKSIGLTQEQLLDGFKEYNLVL